MDREVDCCDQHVTSMVDLFVTNSTLVELTSVRHELNQHVTSMVDLFVTNSTHVTSMVDLFVTNSTLFSTQIVLTIASCRVNACRPPPF